MKKIFDLTNNDIRSIEEIQGILNSKEGLISIHSHAHDHWLNNPQKPHGPNLTAESWTTAVLVHMHCEGFEIKRKKGE